MIGYSQGEDKNNNVHSFLQKHIEKRPDKEILKWVPQEVLAKWDYKLTTPLLHQSIDVKTLHTMVEAIAAGYSKLGITKGDRVILFVPMSTYLYTAMFGLQKIGAIPVFLDSWARAHQLGIAAQTVRPKCMISVEQAFATVRETEFFEKLPIKIVAGPHLGDYDATLEGLLQTPERVETTAVKREHTALITFTTGSSGTPKGADRTHRFLAAQHYALHHSFPYTDKDVDLPVFPIFSLNNLAEGVPTVIPAIDVGAPGARDALIILAQMKATKVSCITVNPFILNEISKYCSSHNIQLDGLKRVITGGAPVSRDNLVDFSKIAKETDVYVTYGSTEVEPISHIESREMISKRPKAMEEDTQLVDEGVNVGKIVDGLKYKMIKINKGPVYVNREEDWEQLEVTSGSVGELIVSGEHVCNSYFNNEEAFHRAKIKCYQGTIWHRTGDLARIDAESDIWLVGRVHNAINRGGVHSFPVRAEIVLKKLPFVKRCAYMGMPDTELGEKIYAVVEVDKKRSEEEMLLDMEMILSKNEIQVDKVVFWNKIPMDSRHNSKVEYAVLREELLKNGI